MKTFLCLIINRDTKEELANYIIERKYQNYSQEYDLIRSVRFSAIDMFEKEHKDIVTNIKNNNQSYYCDSVEI